jgi:antitoxin FitA
MTQEVTPMAQLVVRYLEDSVKEKLRRRAARRRRSLEAEVRDILRDAVARSESAERHLGSRIARRFAGIGLTLDVPELRGHPARPARFKR